MRNAAAQALLCGNRGRSGGFCRVRRSGSREKSGPAGEWQAFRTKAGSPRQRDIPHRQNLPVFYAPEKTPQTPPSAAVGTLSPQARQSRGAASPSPLPPSAKMSCAAPRRMI